MPVRCCKGFWSPLVLPRGPTVFLSLENHWSELKIKVPRVSEVHTLRSSSPKSEFTKCSPPSKTIRVECLDGFIGRIERIFHAVLIPSQESKRSCSDFRRAGDRWGQELRRKFSQERSHGRCRLFSSWSIPRSGLAKKGRLTRIYPRKGNYLSLQTVPLRGRSTGDRLDSLLHQQFVLRDIGLAVRIRGWIQGQSAVRIVVWL